MQEQSVHHVSTQLDENNAIYGITKALPYTKRNENIAYRELKECINYCTILTWGEKKAEFNQHL